MHLPNTSEKKLWIAIPLNLIIYPFGFWYLGERKHFWGHLILAICIQFIVQLIAWIFLQFATGLSHLLLFAVLAPTWWTFIIVTTVWLQRSHKAINLKWGFFALVTAFTVLIVFEPTPRVLMNAYSIPSLSMAPNLQLGDYIFMDLTKRKPKHGDLIAFEAPSIEKKMYLKRVIGVPGDTIQLKYKTEKVGDKSIQRAIFIRNGKTLKQTKTEITDSNLLAKPPPGQDAISFVYYTETNGEHTYSVAHSRLHADVQMLNDEFGINPIELTGYYVIGDNRDRSSDSRTWGQVNPEKIHGTYAYTYLGLDFYQSDCPDGFVDWELSDMLQAGCSFPPVRPDRIGFVAP